MLSLGVPETHNDSNTAGGNVVAGHPNNTVNDAVGVVIGGGGASNGYEHTVGGNYATVSGGDNKTASADWATVVGGNSNTTSGNNAVVGRAGNTASGPNTVVGGGGGNTASNKGATVPGGYFGAAENDYPFVWNYRTQYHEIPNVSGYDGLSSSTAVSSAEGEPTGKHTFSVSARNGVRFVTAGDREGRAAEVTYIEGGTAGWSTTSSRTAKTNIDPVDAQRVLDGVTEMEVATWEYEGDDGEGKGTRYVGPMAEDFHDVVDVGTGDGSINSINADGLAFAAIQGLAERLAEKDERIDDLEAENDRLRERLNAIEEHLGINDQADHQGVADD